MKRRIKIALLLTAAISLLAISLPSFLESENGTQFYIENDSFSVAGGGRTIKYIGPPSPERHDVRVDPPNQHQKPIYRYPRIIFGLIDGIRPLQFDFYYII